MWQSANGRPNDGLWTVFRRFCGNLHLPNPSRQPDTLRLVTRVLGLPLKGLAVLLAWKIKPPFVSGKISTNRDTSEVHQVLHLKEPQPRRLVIAADDKRERTLPLALVSR